MRSSDCDHATPSADMVPSIIGDVCVSQLATNWDSQRCEFPQEVHSQCIPPPCTLYTRTDLFGGFAEGSITTSELADEVLRAMQVPPSRELVAGERTPVSAVVLWFGRRTIKQSGTSLSSLRRSPGGNVCRHRRRLPGVFPSLAAGLGLLAVRRDHLRHVLGWCTLRPTTSRRGVTSQK